MLPPFIIDQIRRREEVDHFRRDQQPRLELPMPMDAYRPLPGGEPSSGDGVEPGLERGVIIVELGG